MTGQGQRWVRSDGDSPAIRSRACALSFWRTTVDSTEQLQSSRILLFFNGSGNSVPHADGSRMGGLRFLRQDRAFHLQAQVANIISPARSIYICFGSGCITMIVTSSRYIRENGANDVTIKILYCGICHTDLHYARNDWGITMYPVVPGYSNRSRLFNSIVHSTLS